MSRIRQALVAVALVLGFLTPQSATATTVDELPAPILRCNTEQCVFAAPDGVVHDGFKYSSSARPGVTGSVPWNQHVSLEPAGSEFSVRICNYGGDGPVFDTDHCGPPATMVTPLPPPDPYGARRFGATGQVNGFPCGGQLPTCAVLECESGGNPQAENSSSSASGLWQIIDGTWNGYAGTSRARYAHPLRQNEKAAQLWAGGAGRRHWAPCL